MVERGLATHSPRIPSPLLAFGLEFRPPGPQECTPRQIPGYAAGSNHQTTWTIDDDDDDDDDEEEEEKKKKKKKKKKKNNVDGIVIAAKSEAVEIVHPFPLMNAGAS